MAQPQPAKRRVPTEGARGRCVGWLLLGVIACDPIPADPVVKAPRNECSASQPCSEGSCKPHAPPHSRDYCEVDEAFDFMIVATMADTSFYAPGTSFLLTQTDLSQPSFGSITCRETCVALPRIARTEGRYSIGLDAAKDLGTILLDAAGAEIPTARLPLRAVYRPLFRLADGRLVEATSVGLPLGPIFARRVLDDGPVTSEPGFADQPKLMSTADLPPGWYEAQFDVDPVLRSVIPPRVKDFEVPVSRFPNYPDSESLQPDAASFRTGTIRSRYRALDDFRAALVDRFTGRTVSRTLVLQGSRAEMYLATFNQVVAPGDPRLPDVDLVVAPPAESPLPTLRAPIITGGALSEYPYPELPERSRITGSVLGPDGSGVQADLEIVSTSIINLRDHVPEDQLSYVTKLSTDARGAFQTVVPEGIYRVFVDPDPSRGLSRREITLPTRGVETNNPVGATSEWSVPLESQSQVSGRARLQDGRVLDGVSVDFAPSIARSKASRFELPRNTTVLTAADGTFSARLDTGFYDVTVTPVSGTRYAPFVLTDLLVRPAAAGPCALEDFVIKVPRLFPMTLRDPNDNRLPYAWARVFARAEGSQHYVELQRELLNDEGFADLWFRKPELAKNAPDKNTPCR